MQSLSFRFPVTRFDRSDRSGAGSTRRDHTEPSAHDPLPWRGYWLAYNRSR